MDDTPGFTKTSRLRQGYEPSQVDAFRARLEQDLASRRGGRGGQLSADDVRGVQFDSVFGGYEMDEVDAYLDHAEAELTAARGAAGPVPTMAPKWPPQGPKQGPPQGPPQGLPPHPSQQRSGLKAAPTAVPGPAAGDAAPADWGAALRERGELLQLMREPAGRRFVRCGRLARGYRVEEVDRFVDTVGASIRTIRPEDIRNVQFAEARGGYDQNAVDAWLDRVEAHVASSSSQ